MVIHPPLDRVSVGHVAENGEGTLAAPTVPVGADGIAWPDIIADRTRPAL